MVQLLERTFDSIPRSQSDYDAATSSSSCRLMDLLGFETRSELEEFLTGRDWQLQQRDGGFWIPSERYLIDEQQQKQQTITSSSGGGVTTTENDFGLLSIDPTTTDHLMDGTKASFDSSLWKDEKIHFLTDVVGFMERQGLDMTAVSREGVGGK